MWCWEIGKLGIGAGDEPDPGHILAEASTEAKAIEQMWTWNRAGDSIVCCGGHRARPLVPAG
jgi:hypothetical protein